MAIQDQQHGDANKSAIPAQPVTAISARGAARRRFTRAGAGATGALLTVISTPGMAIDICTTPSGSLSGGLQSHAGPKPVCSGVSPGYWKNHDDWPVSKTLTYGSIFTHCSRHKDYKSCTLINILDPQDWDKEGIGRHMVGTYLNILSGRISFLTVPQLVNMWNEFNDKGYFKPTATVKWYAYEIVLYLKGTMG